MYLTLIEIERTEQNQSAYNDRPSDAEPNPHRETPPPENVSFLLVMHGTRSQAMVLKLARQKMAVKGIGRIEIGKNPIS